LQKELAKTTPSTPSNKQSNEIKAEFLNEAEIEKYSDLMARIDIIMEILIHILTQL